VSELPSADRTRWQSVLRAVAREPAADARDDALRALQRHADDPPSGRAQRRHRRL